LVTEKSSWALASLATGGDLALGPLDLVFEGAALGAAVASEDAEGVVVVPVGAGVVKAARRVLVCLSGVANGALPEDQLAAAVGLSRSARTAWWEAMSSWRCRSRT